MAIGLAGLLALPAAPCEDIAVLSWDAKYMVLDGDTLAPRDVGTLWWKGVRGISGLVSGSTSKRFAVSGKLRADWAQPHESGLGQRNALVVVTNLVDEEDDAWRGRGRATRAAISHNYVGFSLEDVLWVEGENQLLVRQRERSRVSLLETGPHGVRLNELDAWSDAGWERDAVLACRRGEDLFVATGASRTVRRDGRSTVDALAVPDGFAQCRVESTRFRGRGIASPTVACRGTVGCRREGRYTRVVVDIAENRVVGWHDPQIAAKAPERTLVPGARVYISAVLLFSRAERLLRQEDVWIPLPDAPNAVRSELGPLLRAVDTRTGRVMMENPDGATGKVSRVFCPGKAERTVLMADGQVHLLDLATLETIASAPIPFDRPYYVF